VGGERSSVSCEVNNAVGNRDAYRGSKRGRDGEGTGTRIFEMLPPPTLGEEAAVQIVAGVSLGLYTDRFSVAGDMLSGVEDGSIVVEVSIIIVRSIL
jgi:hypothetical protein